jgi:hydrogenase maturation protease
VTTLIIGYGNPLREDDGVGWYVADRVAERLGDAVKVLRLHQLTPDLAADLAAVDFVVFVDARVDAEGEPARGVVAEPVKPADSPARSHYCAPGTLLATASLLFGRAPVAWLVSVPAHALGFAESLTPATRAAADEAIETIIGLVDGRQGL